MEPSRDISVESTPEPLKKLESSLLVPLWAVVCGTLSLTWGWNAMVMVGNLVRQSRGEVAVGFGLLAALVGGALSLGLPIRLLPHRCRGQFAEIGWYVTCVLSVMGCLMPGRAPFIELLSLPATPFWREVFMVGSLLIMVGAYLGVRAYWPRKPNPAP